MMTMQVTGLRELEAQLVALGAELGQKTLAAAARKAFKPVLDEALRMVPVDSGLTRDSLRLAVKKPKEGATVVEVGLRLVKGKGTDKRGRTSAGWRWHFIEYGTATQAAHPFLRPALDSNAAAVVEAFKVELGKAITRALKKRAKAGK